MATRIYRFTFLFTTLFQCDRIPNLQWIYSTGRGHKFISYDRASRELSERQHKLIRHHEGAVAANRAVTKPKLSCSELGWLQPHLQATSSRKAQSATQANSCDGHLTTACQQALNVAALGVAQQLAGNFKRLDYAAEEEGTWPNGCQLALTNATLIQNIPACGTLTASYYSAIGYANSDFGSTEEKQTEVTFIDNTTCPNDIGNSNPHSNFFFASVESVDPQSYGDFTPNDPFSLGVASDAVGTFAQYDALITDVLAVMMIAFSKNDTSFADTSLSCPSVNTYQEGSRGFPTGLPSPSAGNGRGSVQREALWVGVGAGLVSLLALR